MMKHLKSSICASLLCLRAALLPAADCTSLHLDYMSFTASGNWCGFNTYVATTPKIKYLVESVQQEAAECEASGMMDGYPLSIGLGKYLITPGTVTYSASCTETGAWSVTAWKQNGSSVGSLSASRSVIVTNLSNGYPFIDNYSGKPVSASVQYVPGSGGSRTITCTKDCQWSTNGGSLWSQVVLSAQNATTKVFTNSGNYTPATQTYALSEEYPRSELENTILTRLAACGDPGWGKSTTYSASGCTTASPASKTAESTLSGDTLTLRKIKYRFTFKSEKDAVYNLTWDEVFSFADGSPPQRMPRAETVIGNGDWVFGATHELLPPLGADGRGSVSNYEMKRMPGCCSAASGESAGAGELGVGSIEASFGLGSGMPGQSIGSLYINSEAMSADVATPARLEAVAHPLVETIRQDGVLRQALAPQCLVNIRTNSTWSYDISFVSRSNVLGKDPSGLYETNGAAPMVVWRIENPDPDIATNRLWITEIRPTKSITNEYRWNEAESTWSLLSGNGLRLETLQREWDASRSALTETRLVYTGTNQLASRHVKVFYTFAFGLKLGEERFGDPDNESCITNTYQFLTTSPAYGQVIQTTRSDGSWDNYQYDSVGRVAYRYSSTHLDQGPTTSGTQSRWWRYGYAGSSATNHELSSIGENLLGKAVGWWQTGGTLAERYEMQYLASNSSYSPGKQLYITNAYYTNGPFAGRLKRTRNKDATVAVYFYETNATGWIETRMEGQPDPGNPMNVISGTMNVVSRGLGGEILTNSVHWLPDTNVVLSREVYSDFDELYRARRVDYLDGTFAEFSYSCCGLEWKVDRGGVRTDYAYDDLKRPVSETRNGITTIYTYDGEGRRLSVTRQGLDQTAIPVESAGYDLAGRKVAQTNALGQVTRWQHVVINNRPHEITIYPDNTTVTNMHGRDGSLIEVSGTAAAPTRFSYGTVESGSDRFTYILETRLDALGGTNEWTRTQYDLAGRLARKVHASGQTNYPTEYYYYKPDLDILDRWHDADGVRTLYAYNGKGDREITALDTNQNNVIDYGTDRITKVVESVATNNEGVVVQRYGTYVWNTASTTPVLAASTETSTDGLRKWKTIWSDGASVSSRWDTVYDRAQAIRAITNSAPDGSCTVSVYTNGYLALVRRSDSFGNQLSRVDYAYDAHGRLGCAMDARNGTTTYTYNDADQVVSVTMPAAGPGLAPQVTTNCFDAMGRLWKTVLPDGGVVTNEFNAQGLVTRRGGAREYPAAFSHDPHGRLREMATDPDHDPTAALTTWNYDPYRGWLTNKVYAGGVPGPSYTNTPAGRLGQRRWARDLQTIYSYNKLGDLASVAYSDASSGVTNSFDRLGRVVTIKNSSFTTTRLFDLPGNLLSERYAGGPLDGLTVTNSYDHLLRRTNVALLNAQGTALLNTVYAYDGASRLRNVSDGANVAAYTYAPDSDLVCEIAFTNSGALRMTTSKTFDYLNRLTSIGSVAPVSSVVSFSYAYNTANQRTNAVMADNSKWLFGYDDLGQVTSGSKRWSDGTEVAGQQFGYSFDRVGNRLWTTNNGHVAAYTNNLLNQITSRDVPGWVWSLGEAHSNATVTLWGDNGAWATTSRKGEYFAGELPVTNTLAPCWLTMTNLAVLQDGTNLDLVSAEISRVLVAQTPEVFQHDADGNLTNDGKWTYTWDAENRVTRIDSAEGIPLELRKREDWAYLPDGRWIERVVWTNSGSGYMPAFTNRFIWDGKALLAILDHTNGLIMSFTRGLDMSGSVQGVGGVGGVLAVTMGPAAPRSAGTTHFISCDGNGNVVALTDAATGETTARYEYGPFGEIIRATGLMAELMPLRLSTMYADDVTGDIKFLFRDYRPGNGKWTSADPIGEYGGLNLYGFVCNDPLGYVDNCGLSLWTFLMGMQKCSFTLCYSIGLGEGLWAGTKGTAEALYGLGWYGNPITGLRHIYQDRQKLYQIARGLELLAELVEDGEFDRLLKTTAPNIHKLLHTDPGSPEFCKAYGQVGGQVLLEAVVAVATAGAGMEAKAASKAASEAADLSRALNKAAKTAPGLVHLTDEAGLVGINQSGSIVGRNGIFAVPDYVAGESTAMKVARTGLTPSRTAEFAPISQSAQGLFQQPVPIGPYSAWKYFGGVRYAPPGSINMATGAFSPTSSLIGPSTLIYGPDVLFYGGAAAAGGLYLYGGGDH